MIIFMENGVVARVIPNFSRGGQVRGDIGLTKVDVLYVGRAIVCWRLITPGIGFFLQGSPSHGVPSHYRGHRGLRETLGLHGTCDGFECCREIGVKQNE